MQLFYKDNFGQTQARYTSWWARQEMDGPLLAIVAPRKQVRGNVKKPAAPGSLEQQWLDIDYRIAAGEWELASTYWGGDAFANFEFAYGPGSLALHLGSPAGLSADTLWFHPAFDDLTKAPEPEFDPDEKFWKLTVEMARQAMDHFRGKATVGFPDLVENLDILASLRGTQELLVDLVDHPQHVHRMQRSINQRFFDCYDRLDKILRDQDGGTSFVAFHIWGQGRTCKIQSDISAMLSPEMFAEFCVPYFVEQCGKLDNVLYHLDGPDAIKHVDAVCSLPINAVQWQPGAGKPNCGHPQWYPLLQRILDHGKGVMCHGTAPRFVQPLVEALGSKGLMILTSARSEEEADALYKASKTWKKK